MLSLTLMQIIILFFIFLQLFRFFRLSLISLHSLQIIRFFARWQFACENVKALLDKIIHNILTKVPKKKMISLFFCSTLPSINFIITLIACVDIFCFILCSIWVFFLAYCDWNGSDVDMTVGLELIKKKLRTNAWLWGFAIVCRHCLLISRVKAITIMSNWW